MHNYMNHTNMMQQHHNNDLMYQPATHGWQQPFEINDQYNHNYGYENSGLSDNMMTNMTNMSQIAANSSTNSSFVPETVTNSDFMPAYLRQHIGHWVRVDFLIGEGIEQRVGILKEVGASYIILQAIEPSTIVVCDMYSIKFVTIILSGDYTKLFSF